MREPAPEKMPFNRTISSGSLEESFLVQLFSKPQQTQASSTYSEPRENEKRRSENEITVEKAENGEYKVTLQVGKGRDRILALTFFVPTSDQVETLKKGFLLHVDELCQGIFDTLLKDPGAPPSPGKKSQP